MRKNSNIVDCIVDFDNNCNIKITLTPTKNMYDYVNNTPSECKCNKKRMANRLRYELSVHDNRQPKYCCSDKYASQPCKNFKTKDDKNTKFVTKLLYGYDIINIL